MCLSTIESTHQNFRLKILFRSSIPLVGAAERQAGSTAVPTAALGSALCTRVRCLLSVALQRELYFLTARVPGLSESTQRRGAEEPLPFEAAVVASAFES